MASAAAAKEALRGGQFDCMVLDLGLPDKQGMTLLQELHETGELTVPPVVVYTGQDLNREEELELRNYSDAIILKDAHSEERLLDEASLFLHRVLVDDPPPDDQPVPRLHPDSEKLKGKKVLIPRPYYYTYPHVIGFAGLDTAFYDLKDGKIDRENFMRNLDGCVAVLINSPSSGHLSRQLL